MNKRLKILVLVMLGVILSAIAVININTPIAKIVQGDDIRDKISAPITIDMTDVRLIVKSVERKNSEELVIVDSAIGFIKSKVKTKTRNPFITSSKLARVNQSSRGKKSVKKAKTNQVSRPKVNLEGIIWDEKLPMAIINGDIHVIGDKVGSYTIQLISDSMVTMIDKKDIFRIKFHKD